MVKQPSTNSEDHLKNPRPNKKLKSHDEKVDRISNLPHHILHEILSHLPPKDFAATSVLSKSWNATCKSSPLLCFDQHSFQSDSYRKGVGRRQSVKDFCDHVDKTLLARGITFFPGPTAFQFVVNFASCRRKLDPWLDRWLKYAFRSDQTKEVVVKYCLTTRRKDCSRRRQRRYYVMPSELFSAKSSLEKITLLGCRVGPLLGFSSSLRKLVLVHVEVDRETLESVTWKNLEELNMESCVGFEEVRIRAPKLEKARVWLSREIGVETVVGMEAPRMVSMTWGGNCRSMISSIRASSGGCGNLKEVKVCGYGDADMRRVLVEEVIPASFPTVRMVWNWRGIAAAGWEISYLL